MKVPFTVNTTRKPGTSTASNSRKSTVSTHVELSSLTTFTGSTDFDMTSTALMTTTASTTKLNTADISSQTLTTI